MTSFHNIHKNWPLRDIEPAIINPLVLKVGQEILHDSLCTLLCYLVDMHKLTPKIQKLWNFKDS
jgi:hypothetical protein